MKENDMVLIKGTQIGGMIERIEGDVAYLIIVTRPGERPLYKLSELELIK